MWLIYGTPPTTGGEDGGREGERTGYSTQENDRL